MREQFARVARGLGTDEYLIEKDWHVVRVLAAVAADENTDARLIFTGGTCLSKAWGLIQRFSEDIDFKIEFPAGHDRQARRAVRGRLIALIEELGYRIEGEPVVRNEGQFVQIALNYEAMFGAVPGFRPHIQAELSVRKPAVPPVTRSVASFVALARGDAPEVLSIWCADPVETAAEKLSALAWRVVSRDRAAANDDPAMIRHLHDLAALEVQISGDERFPALARAVIATDSGRGTAGRETEPAALLADMHKRLGDDPGWRAEYDAFVRDFFYGRPAQKITFDAALEACGRIVGRVAG